MPEKHHPLPRDYRVPFELLRPIARGVKRPECILALSDGSLLTSHGSGGYTVVAADHSLQHVIAQGTESEGAYLPNGITLTPDGTVLFAHLGVNTGGVFSISRAGVVRPVIAELEGKPLPPTNYVAAGDRGEVWFTVSTRLVPRSLAWNKRVTDGYIALKDDKGVRILADGLGYTNEIAFSPDRCWVYVNETYAQRISRFPLRRDGTLGQKEVVVQLGGADLPDGLVFDAHGGIWVSCIASNRILLVRPDGDVQVVLEEPDIAFAQRIAAGIQADSLTWSDMQGPPGDAPLGNCSSFAFGLAGSGLGYIGSLTSDCIWEMPIPIDGAPPLHFHRRLTA